MAVDIKFTKFDNTSWGFRLAGGSDFPQPLTVIKVAEGGIAERMGLRVGDVVVRLNDEPISSYTHGKAHEALILAGNNFVLGVNRTEEPEKIVEAIEQENIVPYNIPLEELPPVYSPEPPKELTPVPICVTMEENQESPETENPMDPDEEALLNKPTDANSDPVANKNMTDEEIAVMILEEEELLPDQGVLGVNFKKLRPRAPLLKDSKVFEELQKIATADPPQVQELKRSTTFLQKPQRPPPVKKEVHDEPKAEPYRVIIKKQQKKSVTEMLAEKGLLGPLTPEEVRSQKNTPTPTPTATPEPRICTSEEESSRPGSKLESVDEIIEKYTEEEIGCNGNDAVEEVSTEIEDITRETETSVPIEEVEAVPIFDKEKVKELVTTELSLEKQLENVQSQLLALKQLPSEIESHLRIVSEQLYKIMELSGVQRSDSLSCSLRGSDQQQSECVKVVEVREDNSEQMEDDQNTNNGVEELSTEHEDENRDGYQSGNEKTSTAPSESGDMSKSAELIDESVTREIEIQVIPPDDRVKKIVETYEAQVIRSRDASPALSDRSFKPDPNLSPKDQVIQELQQKQGRKHSKDLWPQPKQVEQTYGRRWKCPNDFFNDEMIAEVLSSQAEVIHGKALGINFKKYEKTALPNFDHLMNSSAYKMIHKMEKEPQKGIPVRPAKVPAAEDILERVKSPASSLADDQSAQSIDH
ncbi:titin isoform X1 [Athalia rosae]|uniref:titin isoform X1 n=2 Tax=Athalia rosae TaxID=37344 RepID=UPI0020348AD4|nr:titin isoform X1 [Athalia rosae]